jgi:hypothetical protein
MTKKQKIEKLKWLNNNTIYNWDDTEIEDEFLCIQCLYWFKIYEYEKILVVQSEGIIHEQEVCPFCKITNPDEWMDKKTWEWFNEQNK